MLTLAGFFDESERTDANEPFSIAGYVFKPAGYKSFCRAWKRVLKAGPTPTTHFHMTRLWAGEKPYRGWKVEDRVEVFRLAVEAIRDNAFCGISVMFSQSDFERLAPPLWRFHYGSIYATACQMLLRATSVWMDDHKSFVPIAYAFERGHRFWDEADGVVRGLGELPEAKRQYRYRTHFALDKEEAFGLQAADMQAWIWTRLEAGAPKNQRMDAFAPFLLRLVEGQSERYQCFHPRREKRRSSQS